jgi:hypothetical protein
LIDNLLVLTANRFTQLAQQHYRPSQPLSSY